MLNNSLSISWPDLKGKPNKFFWKYEWTQHGICSYNSFNQTQYFQLAYDYWRKVDIVAILGQQGISPQINSIQFAQAIKPHTAGFTPELHCADNGELLEIRMCLLPSGNNYTICPAGTCFNKYKFKNMILWKP
ncbi:ribonuclease [Trifolium repens]|jgi:ribonuclease I|nr:ribonuclease [Trifolium repens]